MLASQVTLDSALVNKVLLSGRSLVFSYPTMHTQVSNVPSGVTSHNVTVARAYTSGRPRTPWASAVTWKVCNCCYNMCSRTQYKHNVRAAAQCVEASWTSAFLLPRALTDVLFLLFVPSALRGVQHVTICTFQFCKSFLSCTCCFH